MVNGGPSRAQGGAGVALQLYDTTLLCISSHLAKEYHTTAAKRAQYGELAAALGAKIVGNGCPGFHQWHSLFHHVVWLGDFNYHIDDGQISPEDTLAGIADPDGQPWARLGQYVAPGDPPASALPPELRGRAAQVRRAAARDDNRRLLVRLLRRRLLR